MNFQKSVIARDIPKIKAIISEYVFLFVFFNNLNLRKCRDKFLLEVSPAPWWRSHKISVRREVGNFQWHSSGNIRLHIILCGTNKLSIVFWPF